MKMNILVVDDEIEIADLIEEYEVPMNVVKRWKM